MFINIGAIAAAILVVASGIGYEMHHSALTLSNQGTTATADSANNGIIYDYANYADHANDLTVPFYYDGKITKMTYAYETKPPVHGPWRTDPIASVQAYISNLLPNGFNFVGPHKTTWLTDTATDAIATYEGEQISFHRVYLHSNTTPKTSLVQVMIDGKDTIKTINVFMYQLGHRYEWNIYKITENTHSVPTSSSHYMNAQLAEMSPKQLASKNLKSKKPLPFAGTSVTRDTPNPPINVSSPKAASIFGSTIQTSSGNYPANEFEVIDRWTGSIQGVDFDLEVDRKTDGSKYIVGIADGPKQTAYIFNKQPYMTNFTGSYVVFATPNLAQGNPFYALNLRTGGLTFSKTAYQMSSDYGKTGGTNGMIQGLPESYTSLPNR